MKLIVDHRWRVNASHAFNLPLSASAVWGQMRDLLHFVSLDPLHVRLRFADEHDSKPIPKPGDALVIEHRLCGLGPNRRSRLLRWREGRGYAISDLSQRGAHIGFPHVCMYDLQPVGTRTSRLTITARGKWTATRLPRWLVKAWLWWVLRATAARIRAEMMMVAAVQARHLRGENGSPHSGQRSTLARRS